jgi:hypothetical protein
MLDKLLKGTLMGILPDDLKEIIEKYTPIIEKYTPIMLEFLPPDFIDTFETVYAFSENKETQPARAITLQIEPTPENISRISNWVKMTRPDAAIIKSQTNNKNEIAILIPNKTKGATQNVPT